jgi:AbrB family looped-hinge helix DNA binding protein
MNKNEKNNFSKNCCQVEAIVSFDERGQLVIPKDVRKKFNLKAGEKFAFVSCTDKEDLCCFTLIKTSALQGMVKNALGPFVKEILAT